MTDDRGLKTKDRRWLADAGWLGVLVAAISIATLVAACAPPPRTPVQLHLVGSDSMHALAQSLADAYTHSRPYVTITVRATNSEFGLRAAREYTHTIGLVARALKPHELAALRAVAIARDGIAVIVHPSNPINAIMRAQLVQVFSGEILVWPLGPMAGKPIVVVSREEGSGTRHAFEAMAMQGTRVTLTAVVMPSQAAVVDYVARTPEAIGYVSMDAVTANVRALTIDDVPLARDTVESQKYPFIRTLSFIVPQTADVAMQEFVAFVQSAEGQRIVTQKFARAP